MAYTGCDDTREDLERIAASRGCYLRTPLDHELFLDIDSAQALEQFEKLWKVFIAHCRHVGHSDPTKEITPSASGEPGHYHIVIRLGWRVSALERVMLQACLGSDPMRELLSWRRANEDSEEDVITVFFEKLEGAPKGSIFGVST